MAERFEMLSSGTNKTCPRLSDPHSDDPRITGIGAWLRRTSLAPTAVECPERRHSLVGPRPCSRSMSRRNGTAPTRGEDGVRSQRNMSRAERLGSHWFLGDLAILVENGSRHFAAKFSSSHKPHHFCIRVLAVLIWLCLSRLVSDLPLRWAHALQVLYAFALSNSALKRTAGSTPTPTSYPAAHTPRSFRRPHSN